MLRMKLIPNAFAATLALLASSCAGQAGSAGPSQDPPQLLSWRQIATVSDRTRLRRWRTAWVEGLAKAGPSYQAEIDREGPLLQPDAAIGWKDPPAGTYRCRTIKLGAQSAGMLDYVSYPSFFCRIRLEDGLMSFARIGGSQRPLGLFLPGEGERMVFLGTLQLGDETRALQYGRDHDRDMAGLLERIGDNRWRLVLPYPHFESTIDVVELVPAPPES
jgi:hypothetical protein